MGKNAYVKNCSWSLTLHNVSINTKAFTSSTIRAYNFTFLNVSINTVLVYCRRCGNHRFTFHNVSINTMNEWLIYRTYESLHSTIFLLIQHGKLAYKSEKLFTFHNVSINTCRPMSSAWCLPTLHSTMVLLIRGEAARGFCCWQLYIPQCFY